MSLVKSCNCKAAMTSHVGSSDVPHKHCSSFPLAGPDQCIDKPPHMSSRSKPPWKCDNEERARNAAFAL